MLAYTGPMKIFSGTANKKFAEDICKCLDMPLGEIHIVKLLLIFQHHFWQFQLNQKLSFLCNLCNACLHRNDNFRFN